MKSILSKSTLFYLESGQDVVKLILLENIAFPPTHFKRWAKLEFGREIGDFFLLILHWNIFLTLVYTFTASLQYVYNIYENSW